MKSKLIVFTILTLALVLPGLNAENVDMADKVITSSIGKTI
ncbi:hypothetical protein [Bacillus safensis]|nr:hypothetical protein [Bacillus safensis]